MSVHEEMMFMYRIVLFLIFLVLPKIVIFDILNYNIKIFCIFYAFWQQSKMHLFFPLDLFATPYYVHFASLCCCLRIQARALPARK